MFRKLCLYIVGCTSLMTSYYSLLTGYVILKVPCLSWVLVFRHRAYTLMAYISVVSSYPVLGDNIFRLAEVGLCALTEDEHTMCTHFDFYFDHTFLVTDIISCFIDTLAELGLCLQTEDLHTRCRQELEEVREEFERYKLRAQSVLKSKHTKV